MANLTSDFLSRPAVHLCVDMQGIFAEDTDWKTPWMDRVRPIVERLVAHRPADTIFTRFIPPEKATDVEGAWRDYFQRWHQFTRAEVDPELLDLVPELRPFVPEAMVIDKAVYSPFVEPTLKRVLDERGIETLVVTGAETDVCVLAAVMSAVDFGYRIVLPKDALCSSSDQTHDALIETYARRYGGQVALTDTGTIVSLW